MKKFLATLALALPFGLLAQNDLVELVRSDVRTEMRAIVTLNMGLTEAESEKFWPLYDAYEQDRKGLWDRKIALLKEYAEVYEGMTNEQAQDLLGRVMKLDTEFDATRTKHIKLMEKALPATLVGRFYLIDTRLAKLMDLQLSEEIPLAIPTEEAPQKGMKE
ncbi:MAG: hypothetical protein R2810_10295 [Flavobacteriales bacterium]